MWSTTRPPVGGLHAVQHRGAGRSAAAASYSGQVVTGLYNLVPTKVGQVNELAQSANILAKQIENWQGVDVNVVARLRNGITVQGGTSTGRRLQDACAERAALPELGAGATGLSNNSIAGDDARATACRW